MLISIGLWSFLAIVIFAQVYAFYADNVAHLPSGKAVVGAACMRQDTLIRRSDRRSMPIRVVYAHKAKSAPSVKELTEIAVEIAMIGDSFEYTSPELNEFKGLLAASQLDRNERFRVPEPMARGHELYVSNVMLHAAYLHPSFSKHRVVVLAKTGRQKGKAFLLPWNKTEAQALFSGEVKG